MNGWSGYQSSPFKKEIPKDIKEMTKTDYKSSKSKSTPNEKTKKEHKEGDYTQYEHPTYYNHDGSVNKGGSTGDFDEGELSEVMKNQDGKRYVERSDGKILFLDKP